MSTTTIPSKRSTRRFGLSLSGLGAGLAITAIADDASASVVVSTVTQNIAASGTSATGQTLTIPIDIDGDASPEFNLVGFLASNTSQVYVRVEPVEAGAQVVGSAAFPGLADRLAGTDSIDGGLTYVSNANLVWSETKGDFGNWQPVPQRGFVGVAFDFNGNTHYGSLDVEVTSFNAVFNSPLSEFDATLHGFAWENTPGTAIVAGAAAAPAIPVPIDSSWMLLTMIVALGLVGVRRLF